MLIDQSSLLLAIGFSAAALCIALLIGWLTARGESYQLTFSAGVMVIVVGVVFYLRYTNRGPDYGWGSLMGALLVFSGTQLVVLGLIGEYIGRMFLTVNRRPQSVVRSVERAG